MRVNVPILCIPTLGRYDLLKRLFQSIRDDIYNIEKIVIINNSFYNTGIKNVLCYISNNFPNVDIINNNNIGVSSSWNYCINNYDKDYYFILNDDIELSESSLYKMNYISKRTINRNIIITGIEGTGFHIFSINRQTIENIGLFDDMFYPAYFEDFDYVKRIELFGGRQLKFNDGNKHGDNIYNSSCTALSNFFISSRKKYILKGSGDYWAYKNKELYNQINGFTLKKYNEWILNNVDYIKKNFFNPYYYRLNNKNILNIIYIIGDELNFEYLISISEKLRELNIEFNIFLFIIDKRYSYNDCFDLTEYNIYMVDTNDEDVDLYNNIINNIFNGYIYITNDLKIDDEIISLINNSIINENYKYIDLVNYYNDCDLRRYIFHKDFVKYNRLIVGEKLDNNNLINRSKEN